MLLLVCNHFIIGPMGGAVLRQLSGLGASTLQPAGQQMQAGGRMQADVLFTWEAGLGAGAVLRGECASRLGGRCAASGPH